MVHLPDKSYVAQFGIAVLALQSPSEDLKCPGEHTAHLHLVFTTSVAVES